MTLIEHEARVGLPRMWEHPRRTRTRRGGVVASMVGGYTADTARPPAERRGEQYSQAMLDPERGRKMAGRTDGRGRMSGREKPDAPGLWRDANEKTVVACMESGELAIRDADTGEILSAGQLEQAAPFQRTEWKGIDLTRAGFSAMPDTAGCWSDANGTLWLITGGDGIDGHIFRLKEEGREWGPWARCDFEPMDDEGTHFDWCKPWIADRGWTAEELDDDSGEPSAHGPYARYSLQTVEEVPWKPASDDSTPIHEGSRTVHLPDVRSFGRLERDKWLAVKNLEESAELVEACKQYLKACDPTDPSGIGREFDDHANCLACYGVNVGGELGDDRDKAKAGWIGHVRDQRRQAMLGELADVLQTVGNLITAFGITDEEVGRAMGDCLERNRRKGRL